MIDVINLRKSFGALEVLKGINITINKGDIVAVLGPSGSGKSTLVRDIFFRALKRNWMNAVTVRESSPQSEEVCATCGM